MYYTVYKITNLINNKIYIGVHKTHDINDDYMGSGKILKRAQEKYGIENFKKEILEVFNNAEDMFNMESQLVNEEFIKRDDTYNLKIGGEGGFDHLNNCSEEHLERCKLGRKNANENGALDKAQEALKWLRENDPIWLENKTKKFKDSIKKHYEKNNGSFKGKKHTEEARKKISEASSNREKGKGNSNYGMKWMNNNIQSKKIKKEEIQHYLDNGWKFGKLKIECIKCKKMVAETEMYRHKCKI